MGKYLIIAMIVLCIFFGLQIIKEQSTKEEIGPFYETNGEKVIMLSINEDDYEAFFMNTSVEERRLFINGVKINTMHITQVK